MNLVVPFGFYGWGNIGDEATLQGFARLLSNHYPEMRTWVASRNPSHTARAEPSFRYYKAVGCDPWRWWVRKRSEGCVLAGGTPIMDVLGAWPLSEVAPLIEAFHKQHTPIVFIGTGTERLQKAESRRVIADILAPRVLHWSVRCERDKDRLTDYGVIPEYITVAADLAWTLEAVPKDFGIQYLAQLGLDVNAAYVGVNVNNEKFVLDQEPRLFEKLATLLDTLVEKWGVRILFFCNEVREGEDFDKFASRKVMAYMIHYTEAYILPNQYWTPQQMLSLLKCCQMTIGIRYHFCLFSALQCVPFIALKRSDKVDDLCWDMDWPYSEFPVGLDIASVLDMCSDIVQKRESLIDCLSMKTQVMRDRALRNHLPLDALSRGL